jgi:hypothetical protein
MTLQASGQLSLSDIRTEIGGSGQIGLNDANVRALTGTTVGTQISMAADSYSKSWIAQVAFSGSLSTNSFAISPADAIATITLKTDGNLTVDAGTGTNRTWTTGTPVSGDYEYRFTGASGDTPTSYQTAWTVFSGNTSFTLTETTDGSADKTFDATFEIRETANVSNTSTVSFHLRANVEV